MKRKLSKVEQTTVALMAGRAKEILQMKGRPSQDDLAYALERLDKLKDERLKAIFIEAIGWGDDERAELETFIAVAVEVMKTTSTSKLREATMKVEIKTLMNQSNE